jgi:hypothetical protein
MNQSTSSAGGIGTVNHKKNDSKAIKDSINYDDDQLDMDEKRRRQAYKEE